MVVILKHGVAQEKKEQLVDWLKGQGVGVHVSDGEFQTVLGLIGDTRGVDMDLIASLAIVDSVKRVTESFKCVNRKFHPEDTVVRVGDQIVGGGNFIKAFPNHITYKEELGFGVVYNVMYLVGLEFVEDRNDYSAISYGCEECYSPMRHVTTTNCNLVTCFYTAFFE